MHGGERVRLRGYLCLASAGYRADASGSPSRSAGQGLSWRTKSQLLRSAMPATF